MPPQKRAELIDLANQFFAENTGVIHVTDFQNPDEDELVKTLHPGNQRQLKRGLDKGEAGYHMFQTKHWFRNEYVAVVKIKADQKSYLATYQEHHWSGIAWLFGTAPLEERFAILVLSR